MISSPHQAIEVFGDKLKTIEIFAELLVAHGQKRGFIGPNEENKLWPRHLLNSALLAPFLRGKVADVGSGAGLPGMVLAVLRPELSFSLIDSLTKRCLWLEEVSARLGLSNVRVINQRIEDSLDTFDQITARALGPLKRVIPWLVPRLKSNGELLLIKGESLEMEMRAAKSVIERFGLREIKILSIEKSGQGIKVFRALGSKEFSLP